eukprot:GHVL01002742.1.p1 GENE.GHVL01002742.1~~GHVL01002742.1.p1  ORF type:complete len:350 (-),score=102.46 GHVL01002742.1:94-1143(-)
MSTFTFQGVTQSRPCICLASRISSRERATLLKAEKELNDLLKKLKTKANQACLATTKEKDGFDNLISARNQLIKDETAIKMIEEIRVTAECQLQERCRLLKDMNKRLEYTCKWIEDRKAAVGRNKKSYFEHHINMERDENAVICIENSTKNIVIFCEELKNKIKNKEENINEYKKKRNIIDDLKRAVSELNKTIEPLQRRVEEKERLVEIRQKSIKTLKSEIQNLQEGNIDGEKMIATCEASVKERRALLHSQQEDIHLKKELQNDRRKAIADAEADVKERLAALEREERLFEHSNENSQEMEGPAILSPPLSEDSNSRSFQIGVFRQELEKLQTLLLAKTVRIEQLKK